MVLFFHLDGLVSKVIFGVFFFCVLFLLMICSLNKVVQFLSDVVFLEFFVFSKKLYRSTGMKIRPNHYQQAEPIAFKSDQPVQISTDPKAIGNRKDIDPTISSSIPTTLHVCSVHEPYNDTYH